MIKTPVISPDAQEPAAMDESALGTQEFRRQLVSLKSGDLAYSCHNSPLWSRSKSRLMSDAQREICCGLRACRIGHNAEGPMPQFYAADEHSRMSAFA